VLHAFDYPGAEHFCDRRVLGHGNGVSGHEIASDLATVRYRLDGPGAHHDAAAVFDVQLAASARAAIEPDDVAALPDVGYGDLLPTISAQR
jgi:hypothetical protein